MNYDTFSMKPIQEIFDSDNVDLFEKYFSMTWAERIGLAISIQLILNHFDYKIANRTDGQRWPLHDQQIPSDIQCKTFNRKPLLKLLEEITDVNTDIGMPALSETASVLTERIGFSEEAREILVDSANILTVLMNLNSAFGGETQSFRMVGSQAEGTARNNPEADRDILFFENFILVYNSNQNPETHRPYLHMIEDKVTPPGYKTLQLFQHSHPVNEKNINCHQSLFEHKLIADKGRVFLSNEFTDHHYENKEYERHGPALTIPRYESSTDRVFTLICKALPNEVMPWFRRNRRYGWPSEKTMKLFKKMGCVLVAIGHQNSPEQKFQWRLSFINQEMYLMHNLNMTQYKCYIILKYLRKLFIEEYISESLCSYHLKTVLFYTIENSIQSIWQPKYLAFVVLKCIHRLREWVAEMNCPNYFIPQENMFETKLYQEEKEKLNRYLSGLFDKNLLHLRVLFFHLPEVEPSKEIILLYCSRYIRSMVDIMNRYAVKRLNTFPFNNIAVDYVFAFIMLLTEDNQPANCTKCSGYTAFPEILISVFFMRFAKRYLKLTDSTVDQFLNEMPTYADIFQILINDSILRRALGHVKKYVHSRIASHALLNRQQEIEQDHETIFNFVNMHVHYAGKAHALHTRLKQASYLYIYGHHLLVDVILEKEILMELNVFELPVICANARYNMRKKRRKTNSETDNSLLSRHVQAVLQKLKPDQFTLDYFTDNILSCLRFDTTETVLVPGPLQYETLQTLCVPFPEKQMCENKSSYPICIDPIIYLYYLLYKNKEKMDDKQGMNSALYCWENILFGNFQETKLWHLDTALNCLGHIYETKSWPRLAISCYRKSLEDIPLYNYAKWHIMFILFE